MHDRKNGGLAAIPILILITLAASIGVLLVKGSFTNRHVDDSLDSWLTYTDEVGHYLFKYPKGFTVALDSAANRVIKIAGVYNGTSFVISVSNGTVDQFYVGVDEANEDIYGGSLKILETKSILVNGKNVERVVVTGGVSPYTINYLFDDIRFTWYEATPENEDFVLKVLSTVTN